MVQGSSARLMPETDKLPIDAAVIGLVDEVRVGETIIIPDETLVS
jgi:microcompartment protein CcmK/EutM